MQRDQRARDIDKIGLDDKGLHIYREQLSEQMKRLYPYVVKPREIIIKSAEERKKEG